MEIQHKRWPLKSAGRMMTLHVPIVEPTDTISEVIEAIQKNHEDLETINYIYVVHDRELVGVCSIKDVFRFPKSELMKNVMKKDRLITTRPNTSVVYVSQKALKHNLKAIPVIDKERTFLGVVSSDTIKTIIHDEYLKMFKHFTGITHAQEESYGSILDTPLLISFARRIPWLLIGLLGGIFLAHVVGLFEETLSQNLILAAFIPVIAYVSNAVGIQVQMLFIRDLAMSESLPLRKYGIRQLGVSFLIACTLALGLLASGVFRWAEMHILQVIAIAIMITAMTASVFALIIPYTLKKLKYDPGVASGPFSTIIQDISSVVIYFLVASALL